MFYFIQLYNRILHAVQVTAGLAFFLCSSCLSDNEDCDSLAALTGLAFLAGP